MKNEIFMKLLKEMLAIPAPSGREEKMAEFVRKQIAEIGYGTETDPAGNVLVRIAGKNADASPMIFAAHLDEISVTVTKINPDGSLQIIKSGGLLPWKTGECPVDIIGDYEPVSGLLSFGSAHGGSASGKEKITWNDVKIITGLSPEQLEKKGIRVGSSAVPKKEFRGPVIMGDENDPMVAAWTFDDRAGMIVLLQLLEELKRKNFQPQPPVIIAFTVHEEGGGHGAKCLSAREKPEIFVAVDGCPVIDPDTMKLDGRPGAWSRDRLAHYDQQLIKEFSAAAEQTGTQLQIAVYEGAASDASLVYAAGHAPRIAFIGHVRDNSHGFETARLSVFNNTLKTLLAFFDNL